MAENNRRETTRTVKAETPDEPPIERGKLYFRAQVLKRMRIDAHTLLRWKAAGLRSHKVGTKVEFILGDELIDWIASDAQLPAAYQSPHADRTKRRRKKE